jgi:deazaflavin-dependent oxidoreductase (nitroreductase family)
MNDGASRIPDSLDYSLVGDEHVRRYEETNGDVGYIWNGAPCLILTTTGRRSGAPRKIPLIYSQDGPRYIIVASQGGAPTHPGWYHNLVTHTQVQVQVQAERFPAIARVARDEERTRLWGLVNQTWPSYDLYQSRTGRTIPVVVLERIDP